MTVELLVAVVWTCGPLLVILLMTAISDLLDHRRSHHEPLAPVIPLFTDEKRAGLALYPHTRTGIESVVPFDQDRVS